MTNKVYRSAQGKMVDLGTIMLQNEHVRAVGNMKVNARGDKLDSGNQVIETKTQQVQRQNNRTSTNVTSGPPHRVSPSINSANQTAVVTPDPVIDTSNDTLDTATAVAPDPVIDAAPTAADIATPTAIAPDPVDDAVTDSSDTTGTTTGLAGAIARTRQIKQTLDRTRRQQAQDSGIKKI